MRVAIIGASGYTGLELVRIVLRHPELELAVVTSEQRVGKPAADCFPALRGLTDLCFEANDPQSLAGRVDVAFSCLPHAASATTVAAIRKASIVTLDISADFRLRSKAVYAQWYGEHKAPELFGQAVYGMPEIYRELLPGAALIAAPGCYPTGALLPMLPFLRAGVVETDGIFVDAKSGVSGAGRSLQEGFLFAELDGNSHAYKVGSHRHGPEMEQEASLAANRDVSLTFVPYLIPTIRGIVTSVLMRSRGVLSADTAQEILATAYADEPFVRVLPPGETPKLQSVKGSNYCDVSVTLDERTGNVVALSAIDNLVKGSGGQAVQCLNVMQGWDETTGLTEMALLP
ncbi:MAG: N-acetyl-gamma-glutamyl-phosphate reductase [Myxococcales bacterium]|nr:N-acetyl-gamma-glutamyl-phosphate reductase [Myxococcales bacterium]